MNRARIAMSPQWVVGGRMRDPRWLLKLFGAFLFLLSILVGCHKVRPPQKGVKDHQQWRPIEYSAVAPTGGVTLDGGVFKEVFENNIEYLLNSFTVDQMLEPFRLRAGVKNPPVERYPEGFWAGLPGSCAGRFLMGAGNVLRWVEHPRLRQMMNEVVDGIAACQQPNGYLMAYTENKIVFSEYGNYVRSWVTQGLIEAGIAGNPKALKMIRDYQDWFNHCPFLPEMKNLKLGYQGMIANTRMYFTPVGKPEDIDVVLKYYEEGWWVDQLIAENGAAIWDRPRNSPHTHCYEVTALEAYLDVYRATGMRRYWDAVMGGWELFKDCWLHPGGGFAITEHADCPPCSYHLGMGELCCSVFWTFLNHRLHQLYPERERYIAEIEKEIYNIGFGNQDGSRGIRYHARLHGQKQPGDIKNTCCEGQGTRLYGALPQFIYTKSLDGIFVNLFVPSTIRWRQGDQGISFKMTTRFPDDDRVEITVSTDKPVEFKLRIRIPSWASKSQILDDKSWLRGLGIRINQQLPTSEHGQPGSYFSIDRVWRDGDVVTFRVPMDFRVNYYSGKEQVDHHPRFSVEYGPFLMAFEGTFDGDGNLILHGEPFDIQAWLLARPEKPLFFAIQGHPSYQCLPYFQVKDEKFTCFPVIEK